MTESMPNNSKGVYDMKKGKQQLLSLVMAVALLLSLVPPVQAAGEGIAVDQANFPDPTFCQYVAKNFDTDGNGQLSREEREAVTTIFVPAMGINSLEGIAFFPQLESLICYENQLWGLDVSKNPALKELWCNDCSLPSLDVSNNPVLEELWCGNNPISTLSVGNNPALTSLSCSNTWLNELDVSRNTALISLNCNNNWLTELDVSQNTALTSLSCDGNRLTGLDVSQNTALTSLTCSNNSLSNLDTSNNAALELLYCHNNQLTELDVSGNPNLWELDCSNNQLSALDLSQNHNIGPFYCSGNNLANLNLETINVDVMSYGILFFGNAMQVTPGADGTVDLSRLPNDFDASKASNWVGGTVNGNILTMHENVVSFSYDTGAVRPVTFRIYGKDQYIPLTSEYFPDETFRNSVSEQVDKNRDGLLSTTEILHTYRLDVSGKGIASLQGVELLPALALLYCEENNLTELDLHANTDLVRLSCYSNRLTSLDLTGINLAWGPLYKSFLQWQSYSVITNDGRTVDLSALPGNFDVSKASNWVGGTVSGDILTLDEGATTVTYDYDAFETWPMDVTLHVGAPGTVFLDEMSFPDDTFREYVADNFDTDGNGVLSPEEYQAVTEIDVSGTWEAWGTIVSLQGVEFFPNLQSLDCSVNGITELDVSRNPNLTSLDCGANELTSLVVGQNAKLTYLDSNRNHLSSLDISGLGALEELNCSFNDISQLDVSKNRSLKKLYCGQSLLSELDVSENAALTVLNCDYNQLVSLDLSHNPDITAVSCGYNQLTALDLSYNPKLTTVSCEANRLTSLNLSGNPSITSLHCGGNLLTSLDLTGNPNITTLSCADNRYTIPVEEDRKFDLQALPGTFDVTKAVEWTGGTVEGTTLTAVGDVVTYSYDAGQGWKVSFSLNVLDTTQGNAIPVDAAHFPDEGFRRYVRAYIDQNGDQWLTEAEQNAVTELYLSGTSENNNGIVSLEGIRYFPNLASLFCDNKQLTSLDLSHNTALSELWCNGNQLTSLDVSKNTALTFLDCGNNRLTSLDVSNNPNLSYLDCAGNLLTNLQLAEENRRTLAAASLETVNCSDNQLEYLDVSRCTKLTGLLCSNNRLTSLDLSSNTALSYLSCSGNPLTSLNLGENTQVSTEGSLESSYEITVGPDRTFDLNQLPGGFEIEKASNWQGGTVSGSILTVDAGATVVTYTYNAESSCPLYVTLHVNATAGQEQDVVYRVYNPGNGKHHYTTDPSERDFLAENGWIYEGIAWYAPETGNPIYRVYNPGNDNHLYTMDAAERDRLVAGGWVYEGILCYSAGTDGVPLYRVFNPYVTRNPHHYTDSLEECEFLKSNGWIVEGISWYGLSK